MTVRIWTQGSSGHRERNLADWLGLRKPWPGWKLEAIMTMRAHQVDFSSWVSGRRKWGVERRGPGRTKEDRQRDQLEREKLGRHVQPVVLAEELAERRRRAHATVGGVLQRPSLQGSPVRVL